MHDVLKNNRLPIVISTCALILVTVIGLIPVYQQAGNGSEQAAGQDAIAALVQRVEALELAAGGTEADPAEIPANASNGRLRQEIDIINKALANQTGRVSRIKKQLVGVVDESGQLMPSTRAMDEIALIKRALVNLTKRLNTMDDQFDSLQTAAADINRLQLQMANADRAFIRLTAALREQKQQGGQFASLQTAGADIERLQKQMANADRAFIRLTGTLRAQRQQGDQMIDALAEEKQFVGTVAALLREEKRHRDQMAVALSQLEESQREIAKDVADMKALRQVLEGILQSLPK